MTILKVSNKLFAVQSPCGVYRNMYVIIIEWKNSYDNKLNYVLTHGICLNYNVQMYSTDKHDKTVKRL